MKSFLVSQLARTYPGAGGAAGPEAFVRAHPHAWVLWEPGAWRPPGKSTTTVVALPQVAADARAGEALALALEGRPDAPGRVRLGRAPECELVINDGTLSSVHLLFLREPGGAPGGGWTVRDGGSRNGSWLDGVRLAPGQPQALASGARLQAAQVSLTFYTPEGLLERLRGVAAPRP
ncbi:FHA domain-containing protein [Aggregicoccus sp. 17bor-14]|uniref:FHA domain-containing protein n=1 Tax=Myxococcaceae TaxID=31 RepID=UPI00129C86C5|nr:MULTISPECIES: FHA domain-containing protein [Myxococcaceae]MBF5043736.1 FHA domain-containing protein [Simulacricoccus sp. 17bor-14]MRI89492.1 FHA domain-containing protein [Aggregicoccus sp. 17bor-14]